MNDDGRANKLCHSVQLGSPSWTICQRQRHLVILDVNRYMLMGASAEFLP